MAGRLPDDHRRETLMRMRRTVRKAICYVVREDHLLVLTHNSVPMEVTGVQVPAGTVRPGEDPADAAVRELHEETGLRGAVVRFLGEATYDLWPTRPEIASRHFFQLEVPPGNTGTRWEAGEPDPENGGAAVSWTCWWLPLPQAHVLAGGLGAMLGRLAPDGM